MRSLLATSSRSFWSVLAISAAGLLSATGAAAQGGWVYCASEGQSCNVSGPATVRYGADGDYAYRSVNGPVPCNNSVFGDPARGESKQCSYRPGHGHGQGGDDRYPGNGGGGWSGNQGGNQGGGRGWQFCAEEDGYCNFRGSREVRFGAAGRYAVRSFQGGAECSVRVFGDPVPGVRKACEVRDGGGNWGGGYDRPPVSNDRGWQFCAEEDGYCRPPRGATVRFGANGRYAYMNGVQGGVPCSVHAFGDPIKGEHKRCEYEAR